MEELKEYIEEKKEEFDKNANQMQEDIEYTKQFMSTKVIRVILRLMFTFTAAWRSLIITLPVFVFYAMSNLNACLLSWGCVFVYHLYILFRDNSIISNIK